MSPKSLVQGHVLTAGRPIPTAGLGFGEVGMLPSLAQSAPKEHRMTNQNDYSQGHGHSVSQGVKLLTQAQP